MEFSDLVRAALAGVGTRNKQEKRASPIARLALAHFEPPEIRDQSTFSRMWIPHALPKPIT